MMTTLIASALAVTLAPQNEPDIVLLNNRTFAAPRLEINEILMIDNVDQGDMFGANRADLYALVTVNGTAYKTKVVAKDHAKPNWQIPLDMSKRLNTITIQIMDDDGGFERRDDHIDISPIAGKKNMSFTYNRATNELSGEASGKALSRLTYVGKGDDDRAQITFRVVDY